MKNILFLGVMAAMITSCGGDRQSSSLKKVKTVEAVSADATGELSFPAKVVSDEKYNLSFKVAGRIASTTVDEGAVVRKGQLIATLDPRDYQVAFDAVQAEYNSVKAEADRVIAIYNENATAANNYDKAVYGLQQITAKLDHARDQLKETKLYAPVSGVVKNVYRRQGEVIGAGMPVVEIVDDSHRLVEIKIPASDYIRLADFERYSCRFSVYPDREFILEPFSASSVANANQLYTVKLRFKSGQEPLPSIGMTTSVDIVAGAHAGESSAGCLVPLYALSAADGDKAWLYVVNPDSVLSKIDVTVLSLTNSGEALVHSDQSLAGRRIVAAGVSVLHDGQKVEPLTVQSTTNVGGLM